MAIDGEPVPGTFAAEDELFGIGRVLGELGTRRVRARARGRARRGPRRARARDGVDAQARRPRSGGRSRSRSRRTTTTPSRGGACSSCAREAAAEGAPVRPQVAGRPVSLLLGLQTFHPFAYCPSWAPIGGASARGEGRGDARSRSCGAGCSPRSTPRSRRCAQFLDPERAFPIGARSRLRARRATQRRRHAPRARAARRWRCSTTSLMDDDGRALVLRPLLNYTDFSLDAVREMLAAPDERVGPRRRRRALRHDVRREHADVHAHALGARPRPRPAPARVGRAAR